MKRSKHFWQMKGDTLEDSFYHEAFGCFRLVASANGIVGLEQITESETKSIISKNDPLLVGAKQFLLDYFNGLNPSLKVPLNLIQCSDFQKNVLELVSLIPYGQTRTYKDIAEQMGDSKLTRAVGHANATNPCPILIPCHRVIGSDGDLRGYVFGKSMKEALLSLENPKKFSIQGALF